MVKTWILGLAAALVLFVGEATGSALSKQDVSIPMDDGVSISATLYLPDGAAPAGGWPAIVFLHGLAGTKEQMNALVEAYGFVGQSYAVLSFDARGHGKSGGLVTIDGPREIADTRAVHAWLAARPDVADAKIGAWGISYGGGAVFNSLVAGVPWGAVVTVETWTDLYSALMPQGLVKSGLVAGLAGSIPEAKRDPSLVAVQAAAFAGNAAVVRPWAAERSSLSKLGSVTTPVFMAQGRRDFLFGIDQAALAFKRLKGPKLLYLGLHGHAPSTFPAADTGFLMAQVRVVVRLPPGREPLLAGADRVRTGAGGLQERAAAVRDLAAGDDLDQRRVPGRDDLRANREAGPHVRSSRKGDRGLRLADGEGHDRRERRLVSPRRRADRAHAAGQGDRRQRRRSAHQERRAEGLDQPREPGDLHSSRLAPDADARVVLARAVVVEPPLSRSPDGAERTRSGRERGARDSRPPQAGHEVSWRLVVAAFVALVVVAGAGARPAQDPGVTPATVALGGTVPLTGEAAAFGSVGAGAKAYFDYVNETTRVHGRRISYTFYDDAYNPAQTVQLTRKLVEEDKVFAVFNTVGTSNSLAVREYLNARKVPQLFAADGSQAIGRSFARYPWTMGFLMSYRGEGDVYGTNIAQTRPRARIAVLYENTELGRDMLAGLTRAIAGKGPKIVAKESYEFTGSDVTGQIAKLKASRADTLMLFATPKFFIQAAVSAHKLAWKPRLYIASVSIEPGIMAIARTNAPELTKGALSIAFVKNPNDPVWKNDKTVALYRTIMRQYNPQGRVTDVYNWYGMTVAWTMVETMRKAGPNLTRASLLRAAQSLNLPRNPFLLPGIRLQTSRTDYRPMEHVYLYRYDNKQWVKASGLLRARG